MGMYANYEAQISYRAIERVFGAYGTKLEHDSVYGTCCMTRATFRKIQDIRDDTMEKIMEFTNTFPRDSFDLSVMMDLRRHHLDVIMLTRRIEEAFGAMDEEHRDKWEAQTGKSIQDNWELVNQEIEALDLYFV